jgi:hypothetical protein
MGSPFLQDAFNTNAHPLGQERFPVTTIPTGDYHPITMFDSIAFRERSRSAPVCCI